MGIDYTNVDVGVGISIDLDGVIVDDIDYTDDTDVDNVVCSCR